MLDSSGFYILFAFIVFIVFLTILYTGKTGAVTSPKTTNDSDYSSSSDEE